MTPELRSEVMLPIDMDTLETIMDVPCRKIPQGIVVSFGFMFPWLRGRSLAHLCAGLMTGTHFFPTGSVASSFFKEKHDRQKEEREKSSGVYFIQSGDDGPVKIGLAQNPRNRLAGLQTSHPVKLKLLAFILQGGRDLEKSLHARFRSSRLNGEWFTLTPALQEIIDAANADNH